MKRVNNPNLLILETVVHRLGSLTEEFVFLGGCAAGLLITDAAASPVRETIDVDVMVQVLSKQEYYALAERLRARGFSEDSSEGAPICRWTDCPGATFWRVSTHPAFSGCLTRTSAR